MHMHEPALLTDDHVRSALVTLAEWSSQRFSDEDRAAWRTALRGYRQGEFTQAIAAWQRTDHGHLRPRPGDLARFLERPAARASVEQTERRLAELRATPSDWPTQAERVRSLRQALRGDS
jgi:hypothetical protein